MYNITPERFETELRNIASATYRWDRRISDRLTLLADRLHEPTQPCDCIICKDRYLANNPIKPVYMTPDQAARYCAARRQD